MEKIFHQKVAIITGAGQGIGLQIAGDLAKQGAMIVLNDLETGLADEAVRTIIKEKGTCISAPGDAADPDLFSQWLTLR